MPSNKRSATVAAILAEMRAAFVAENGREPGPDDPIYEELMEHPERAEAGIAEDMRQAGIDPAVVYAFEKSGLLVTEMNWDQLTDEEREEWRAAIEEFRGQDDTELE